MASWWQNLGSSTTGSKSRKGVAVAHPIQTLVRLILLLQRVARLLQHQVGLAFLILFNNL